MRAYERLIEYVKVPTPSAEESTTHPTSQCQFDLANKLVAVSYTHLTLPTIRLV